MGVPGGAQASGADHDNGILQTGQSSHDRLTSSSLSLTGVMSSFPCLDLNPGCSRVMGYTLLRGETRHLWNPSGPEDATRVPGRAQSNALQ